MTTRDLSSKAFKIGTMSFRLAPHSARTASMPFSRMGRDSPMQKTQERPWSRMYWSFVACVRKSNFRRPRHRRDVVLVTASARWRGGSTPSTRRCPRHRVCSMAWRSTKASRNNSQDNLIHGLISTPFVAIRALLSAGVGSPNSPRRSEWPIRTVDMPMSLIWSTLISPV